MLLKKVFQLNIKKSLFIVGLLGIIYPLLTFSASTTTSTSSTSTTSTNSSTSLTSTPSGTDSSKLSSVVLSTGGKTARVTPQSEAVVTEYYQAPATSAGAGECCTNIATGGCSQGSLLSQTQVGNELYWSCENTYGHLSSNDPRWNGLMLCSNTATTCDGTNTSLCCSTFNSNLQVYTMNVVYALPISQTDYNNTQPLCAVGATFKSRTYKANPVSAAPGMEYYTCTTIYNPNDASQVSYYNTLSTTWVPCSAPASSAYCTTQYSSETEVPPTILTWTYNYNFPVLSMPLWSTVLTSEGTPTTSSIYDPSQTLASCAPNVIYDFYSQWGPQAYAQFDFRPYAASWNNPIPYIPIMNTPQSTGFYNPNPPGSSTNDFFYLPTPDTGGALTGYNLYINPGNYELSVLYYIYCLTDDVSYYNTPTVALVYCSSASNGYNIVQMLPSMIGKTCTVGCSPTAFSLNTADAIQNYNEGANFPIWSGNNTPSLQIVNPFLFVGDVTISCQ